MPLYSASFANVYAYAKKVLPTLEGETPKIKCYAICADNNYDVYTGFTVQDKSGLVESLEGSGEQTGLTIIGDQMAEGDTFPDWCSSPTAENTSSSSGFITQHYFGILYIDKPSLVVNMGDDAPHSVAAMNLIRKAIRNAGKLLDVTAVFPDFSIGDQCWVASDIAEMQQWVIDNCGKVVIPDKITDAEGLTEREVKDDPVGQGVLTVAMMAFQFEVSDFEYFCRYIASLLDLDTWGFSFADTLDAQTNVPDDERPGKYEGDAAGSRVCAEDDYVLSLQMKELAEALEYMRAGVTTFDWTASGNQNWVEGTSGNELTWADAKSQAKSLATGDTLDGSPSQGSNGNYTADDSGSAASTSSSSSSSSVDVGSESSSSVDIGSGSSSGGIWSSGGSSI